jgi:RecA/RadA recombinase
MATAKKASKKTTSKKQAAAEESKAAPKQKKTTVHILERDIVTTSAVSMDRREALDAWCGRYNKPDHTVATTAGNVKSATDLKCPSGIMSLDVDCGGGLPANRLSLISGPDNSGKTFLMLKYMVMHQRLYGANSSIGVALVEGFDYWRARQVGLMIEVPDNLLQEQNEIRRLDGRPPLTAEEVRWYKTQVGEVRFIRGNTGEETMNLVLEAVRSKLFGFIGIDSLNSMVPYADVDKDVGDVPKRGGNALLMTDFMKKYQPLTNALDTGNYTTVVGLGQVRANAERANAPAPMQKYIKEWTDSMAWAIRHLRSIGLQIWRTGSIKGEDGAKIGGHLHWSLVKGKDGTHDGITGETAYYHPPAPGRKGIYTGTDDLGTIITEATRWALLQPHGKSGHSLALVHPTTKEVLDTFTDANLLVKMLASDFDYELKIRRLVLLAANKSCLYTPLQ